MLFIIALYALKNLNGVLNGRLVNSYRLETSFKCAVLFNVLSVLLKGSSAYYLQLATAESRLQDIGCVHGRAFAVPCANDIVYLVDKEDNVAFCLYLVDKAFYSALKLTSELSSRNESSQVKEKYFLVGQLERYLPCCYLLSKTLCNGSFADAGFTDKAGIVFLPAAEYLNGAGDLFVSSDYPVKLAFLCTGGKVSAERVKELSFLVLASLAVAFAHAVGNIGISALTGSLLGGHVLLVRGLCSIEQCIEKVGQGVCSAHLEHIGINII